MNYMVKRINDEWKITANDEPLAEVYPTGTDARKALEKLRNGYTATTVATISRKQAARREAHEALGK